MLTSSSGLALGRIIGYEELNKYFFGTIEKVSNCGGYSYKNSMGGYRLIQSHIYGGSMLFVDQVEFKENYLQVVRGWGFKEINNDHLELNITQTSCDSNGRTVIITGRVDGSGHEEELKYYFKVSIDMKTGKYTYNEF